MKITVKRMKETPARAEQGSVRRRARLNRPAASNPWTVFARQVLLLALTVLLAPTVASAAVYTVTKTADTSDGACDADCSLREAITAANANAGTDTVSIPAGTYIITLAGSGENGNLTGDYDISTARIDLAGAGSGSTIIDGNGLDRLFDVRTAGVAVTFTDLTLMNGTPGSSGGCVNSLSGNIDFTGTIVTGCTASTTGGAAYTNNTSTITIDSSTFSGNSATTGSGGALVGGSVSIAGSSSFSGNSAGGNGGAIYTSGASPAAITITSATGTTSFTNNSSSAYGGAVYASGAASITGATFDANHADTASQRGGAIHVAALGQFTDCTITNNSTAGQGGGINGNGAVEINNSTISNNTAGTGNGGGVYAQTTLTITATTTITGNTGGAAGGAAYSVGAATIDSADIDNNHSTTANTVIRGGGIGAGGNLAVTNSSVTNNWTFGGGGGLSGGGTVTITGSTITGNQSTGAVGGGVYSQSTATVTDSTVANNSAGSNGGGILANGDITATRSTFSGNSSGSSGGGLYRASGTISLYNSTISANTSTATGGGVWTQHCTITNATIYGNSAGNAGTTGGVYETGTCTYTNTITAANTGNGAAANCGGGAKVSNGYNIESANTCGFAGAGDLPNTDPLVNVLASNGGPTQTHGLQSTSPAIDKADNAVCAAAPINNIDQRGQARPIDGDVVPGAVCDIGAYEYVPITTTISGTVYSDEGTSTVADGTTIRLLVNGVSGGADTTSGGAYSIATTINAGDALLVYIDSDGGSKGNTVTVSDGGNLGGLNIYADRVITRHDNGGSLTNAQMATALGAYSDTDILYSVSGGELTANGADTELFIWSGHTFAPAGAVTATHVDINGALNVAANPINVAGNWDAAGGVFTSTGTVTFNANSGTVTIIPGGVDADHDFQNIVINDAAGTATFQLGGAMDADGDFTVTDGIFDTTATNYAVTVAGVLNDSVGGRFKGNGSTITVGGDLNLNANNDATESTDWNSATLVLNGAGSNINYAGLASWWANGFNNLTVGQGGVTDTLNYWLAVKGTLTIGTGGLTSPATTTLALTKAGDVLSFDPASTLGIDTLMFLKYGGGQNLPTLNNGYGCNISIAGGSSLVVSQTGNVTLGSGKNLLITGDNNASRALSLNTGGFSLSVGGNLVIGAGNDTGAKGLTANSSTITVGGNFTVNPGTNTFTPGDSTVVLNGSGQTISGSTTFHNLNKSVASADTLTFQAGSTTSVNGTVTLRGASGELLTLASSTGSSAWNFVVNESATKMISYVSVSWSDASGSHASQKPIAPSNSVNGGNTTDWFAPLPSISVLKSSTLVSDPVNDTTDPLHIPGAIVSYQIQTTNSGAGSPDADTVVVIEALDSARLEFDVTTGVIFTPNTSGLTLDTVSFSHTATPTTFTYTPTGPFDPEVAGIKVTTTGAFAGDGANFTVSFRVRVK